MRGISWLAAKPVSFSWRTLLHGAESFMMANLGGNIIHKWLSQQSSNSPYSNWGVQKAAVKINHVAGCKTELREVSTQNCYYSVHRSVPIRTQLLTAGFYDMPHFSLHRHSRLEPKEQQAGVWVTNTVALTKRIPLRLPIRVTSPASVKAISLTRSYFTQSKGNRTVHRTNFLFFATAQSVEQLTFRNLASHIQDGRKITL